jgi:hypothetical protein
MQRAFGGAGLGRRPQFGPREICFEELVGDGEAAAIAAVEQVVAAGKPKILGRR